MKNEKLKRCLIGHLKVFLVILFFASALAMADESINRPRVLVSVAPYKFFINKIAKDTLQVDLMVPAGASAHTYEPTPKQILHASQADLWFTTGEVFENRAVNALKSHRPNLKVIDLQKGVHLIRTGCSHGHCSCCPGGVDLHFWLSAREAQTQAETIAEALIDAYPHRAAFYRQHLKAFQQELQDWIKESKKFFTQCLNVPFLSLILLMATSAEIMAFFNIPSKWKGKTPRHSR